MAELGAVIAIMQLADRVVVLCKYWIEAVRDAPSDLRSILLETSMLRTIFDNLEFLIRCDDTSSFSSLCQDDGPIAWCRQILLELVRLIPTEGASTGDGSISSREKMATMTARLAWPFKQSKARKLLEELGRYKSAITLALTTDSIQDIKNIKTKTTQIFDILSEHQRSEFYRWLQQTDPSPIHNRARKQFEEGTCSWVLRLPEWADWLAAKYRCLWIHGIPGAGKTVLASYLVEETKSHCDVAHKPTITTLYYYCYYGHNQDEAPPFLKWLITQLCRRSEAISADTYHLFKQGCEPSLPQLLNALADAQDHFETIYILLDAVDESNPRDDLLKIIRDLTNDPRFRKIQLLVTSREYLDIEKVLGEISKPLSMSNPSVENDIQRYVQSALQNNPNFKRWPEYLLKEVRVTLSTRAKGMFRWAVCQVDRLRRLPCEVRVIRHALATLPKTLEETYEKIFLDIPDEERLFVQKCLTWINFHNELYGDSIPCAILLQALQFDKREVSEYNNEDFFHEENLREICGCLITVSLGFGFNIDDEEYDLDEIPVISFAHYTVREFLDSDRISASAAAYFRLGERASLDTLKIILQTALTFGVYDSNGSDDRSYWRDESESDLPKHKRKTFKYLSGDFKSYCTVTASFSIARYSDEIARQQDLSRMTFRFLDPSSASNQYMMRFFRHCDKGLLLIYAYGDLSSIFEFWSLVWTAKPNSTTAITMILFSILLLVPKFEGLAKELLYFSGNRLDYMHQVLQCQLVVEGFRGHFNGPMIEFFAQQDREGQPRLKFLLDHQLADLNPTTILYAYMGRFNLEIDENGFGLHRLIDLGADPNDDGYTTTPLQIAVAEGIYSDIEILLNAGADPNGIGNSNATRWRSFRTDYRALEGKSALFICQNKMRDTYFKYDYPMIETLLLQYGAKSFTDNSEAA